MGKASVKNVIVRIKRTLNRSDGTSIVRILLVLLFACGISQAQTVSYWFSGWQRKPDAAQAQAYFMLPGTNVTFTYTNNRVIINAGTNGGSGTSCCQYVYFATNWGGSNVMWLSLSNLVVNATNDIVFPPQTNIFATNLIGFLEGTNILFTTNGSGFLSVNCTIDTNSIVSNQTNIFATNLIGFLEGTNILFTTNASGFLAINNTIDTNAFSFTQTNIFATNLLGFLPGTNISFSTNGNNLSVNCDIDTNVFAVPCVIFSTSGLTTNQAGCGSIGYGDGNLAVGNSANAQPAASNRGTAVGVSSVGYDQGTAVGNSAEGYSSGSAVGYGSQGFGIGATVGQGSKGFTYGAAVGALAFGFNYGASLGYSADSQGNGVAIGIYAKGRGIGNVAIAGTDDANNHPEVPIGWVDTVELGRGTASMAGGFNFRGFGVVSSNFVVIATNFYTTVPKWVDIPMNYAATTLGSIAPSLTAVTNGSVIMGLGFDNNDEMFAQAQFPHTLAITNAAFPDFYFEPHVHFTAIGAGKPSATQSNVTWRIEWQIAPINGSWVGGTNSVTMGVTNNHIHYVADLGHITNNALSISSVFRCRLMRPASANQEYDSTPNSHEVIMDAFDLHVPVGNTNAIGSSTDMAP